MRLPAMFTFRRHVVIGRSLVEPDPADLGTAYGLDACLDEEPPAPPARQTSREDERPLESPTAWLSRRR